MAHLLEVATGFRSGDPLRPGPGEPKPEYDPATTTLTSRRRAKVAELKALDPEHARTAGPGRGQLLDADPLGERPAPVRAGRLRGRTVAAGKRRPSQRHRGGPGGDPRGPPGDPARGEGQHAHPGAHDPPVRPREVRPARTQVPSYPVRCGGSGRSGSGPAGRGSAMPGRPQLPGQETGTCWSHRPGQVVALDTTVLPVMVREGVFGDPVKCHLTLALDVCTHSLCAFRLTLVSDTSVDVAMLLRDVMMPLPMRAGLGRGPGMALPGPPGRGGRRVRRAQGGRPAVLHPRDGDHRPRRRLPQPPPGGGRSG